MYQSKEAHSIISNLSTAHFEDEYNKIKEKITQQANTEGFKADQIIKYLDELSKFNLGKYLIANRGLNGKWAQYIVLHPQEGRITGLNDEGKPFSDLERWILDKSPLILATQERFFYFQRVLEKCLKEKVCIASIPCGAMDDLLGLNFTGLKRFQLTGVDLDEESINYAKENARINELEWSANFLNQDAWNMNAENEYDVIVSNGLNIYESDNQRIVNLYLNFYNALKVGGKLITSFITPNTDSKNQSCWDLSQINKDDLEKQNIIFGKIIDAKWEEKPSTESEVCSQLEKAGFKNVTVIYDRQKIFPTVTAEKA